MTKYELSGEISQTFNIKIEANSEEEAKEKVEDILNELSYEELVGKHGCFLDTSFLLD